MVTGICNEHVSVESQDEKINEITKHIQESDQRSDLALFFFTERAIRFLGIGSYQKALDDFDHVLGSLFEKNNMGSPLFGSALWGRLLCHAYADNETESYRDLELIRSYFMSRTCCDHERTILTHGGNSFKILRIAQFADPNENVSSGECKSRVRGTASLMRVLVLKIPNNKLAATINLTISELERFANGCCEGAHWTECLSPVIDAWHYLKNCMDKGVAIAPRLVSPSR